MHTRKSKNIGQIKDYTNRRETTINDYRSRSERSDERVVVFRHSEPHIRVAREIEILKEDAFEFVGNSELDRPLSEFHIRFLEDPGDESSEDDLLIPYLLHRRTMVFTDAAK